MLNKLKQIIINEIGIGKKRIHSKYGVIYEPIYNYYSSFDNSYNEIELYNKYGNKMDLFFFRDYHTAHDPYYPRSDYFIFDRYNYGLKTHFYSHNTMLQQFGKPEKKYGILYETPAIVPKDYEIFNKNKGLEKDFDLIFTYSTKILDSIENSRFVPFQASPWYGTDKWGGIIDENLFSKKTKDISFLCSKKILCPLHRMRFDLAMTCKNNKLADTYGNFDGGDYVDIDKPLTDYRFSIVIENEIEDLYFSERLTNCFMSMTIPIYCGAEKIGDYFNIEGIIQIKPEDFKDIKKVLSKCTKEYYESKKDAIIDNFNRVQDYKNVWNLMYKKYFEEKK